MPRPMQKSIRRQQLALPAAGGRPPLRPSSATLPSALLLTVKDPSWRLPVARAGLLGRYSRRHRSDFHSHL
jgi:hypothetical protein